MAFLRAGLWLQRRPAGPRSPRPSRAVRAFCLLFIKAAGNRLFLLPCQCPARGSLLPPPDNFMKERCPIRGVVSGDWDYILREQCILGSPGMQMSVCPWLTRHTKLANTRACAAIIPFSCASVFISGFTGARYTHSCSFSAGLRFPTAVLHSQNSVVSL